MSRHTFFWSSLLLFMVTIQLLTYISSPPQPANACCSLQEGGSLGGRDGKRLSGSGPRPPRVFHSSWRTLHHNSLEGTHQAIVSVERGQVTSVTSSAARNIDNIRPGNCYPLLKSEPTRCIPSHKSTERHMSCVRRGKLPRRVFRAPFIQRGSYLRPGTAKQHDKRCRCHSGDFQPDPSLPDWYNELGSTGRPPMDGDGCTCSTGESDDRRQTCTLPTRSNESYN